MKFKRTVRLTAIILALAMMPLWLFGCGRLDSKVSDRLAELLEGDKKIDAKSNSGKLFVSNIDAEVSVIKGTASADGNWPSTTITNEDDITVAHQKNMFTLAKAWATKGSEHYHSRSVMKIIKNALEYNYEKIYGTPTSGWSQRNISETDRLDIGENLLNTLLILEANGKISNKNLKKYAEILEIKFPAPFGEASDIDRCIYIMIGTAALMGDTDRIKEISEEYLSDSFSYVTSGSGLYADGSYIDSGNVAASGSYGITAFSKLTSVLYALNGTKADLPDEVNALNFLYDWAMKSVIPSLYNGTAIATTASSYIAKSDEMGGCAVSALLVLAELLDNERAEEIRSIVKAYSSSGNTTFVPYLTNFGLHKFQSIEKDNDLVGRSISGAHPFAAMDKLIIAGPRYSAALSISSIRSAKFETRKVKLDTVREDIGAVNGQGWFTGDGMLLVYNPYYQISDIYWEYVNYARLPGTTVDSRPRTAYHIGSYSGSSTAAGFVVNGDFCCSKRNVQQQ